MPHIWSANSNYSKVQPHVFTPTFATKVEPRKTGNIKVLIAAPTDLKETEKWLYGGFINITESWEGETTKSGYVAPYSGYNGNYRKMDIFTIPILAPRNTSLATIVVPIVVPTGLISATLVNK